MNILPVIDTVISEILRFKWLFLPLIGAIIGYITNVVAIRMLFRPLKEKRLFGIRVPLTPGIIPRQRHGLSENISVMVSRDLITEDSVRRQLSTPAFEETIRRKLHELFELVLFSPVRLLPEKIRVKEPGVRPAKNGHEKYMPSAEGVEIRSGERGAGKKSAGEELPAADSIVIRLLTDFFRSEGFIASVRKTVRYAVEAVGKMEVSRLLGSRGEKITERLSGERVENFREPLKRRLRLLIMEQIRRRRHFSDFLTPQVRTGIVSIFDHLYPSLFEVFLDYLRKPSIRLILERRGRVLLRRILDKLSNFQKFFVLVGQYDRTLDEHMDVVVDDLIVQLEEAGRNRETRGKLGDSLEQWLGDVAQKSVDEFASAWKGDFIEDVSIAVDTLFDWLGSEDGLQALHNAINGLVGSASDQEIESVIEKYTGIDFRKVSVLIGDWVGEIASEESPNVSDGDGDPAWTFIRTIALEVSSNGEKSIGEILGLGKEDTEIIEQKVFSLFIGVLHEQVPLILESINVRTLVVEKIDGLEIEKVEELILQVIRAHLRWISAFGALLGFLIGALQLLFIL